MLNSSSNPLRYAMTNGRQNKKKIVIHFDPVSRVFDLDNGVQDTPLWQSV